MAAIATQSIGSPGSAAAVTVSSCAGGGDTVNGRSAKTVYIQNTDGSSHSFTVATPGTVDSQAVADPATVVAAGAITPFAVTSDYVDTSGNVNITYTAATGMKIWATST